MPTIRLASLAHGKPYCELNDSELVEEPRFMHKSEFEPPDQENPARSFDEWPARDESEFQALPPHVIDLDDRRSRKKLEIKGKRSKVTGEWIGSIVLAELLELSIKIRELRDRAKACRQTDKQ